MAYLLTHFRVVLRHGQRTVVDLEFLEEVLEFFLQIEVLFPQSLARVRELEDHTLILNSFELHLSHF